MSIMLEPSTSTYDPSLSSSTMEQGSLPAELLRRTSSLESDKGSQIRRWSSPLVPSATKDSFLAFCNEVLQFNNEEDEEDHIASSARDNALTLTEGAYTNLPHKWRKPRIASDGGGGVRLTWRSGEKELRAVFPTDVRRTQYLYVEQGDKHSLIPNFTSASLSYLIDWLYSA